MILFAFLVFIGLAYLLGLQFLYPTLIPGYGGGERFSLTETNNYTSQMPRTAKTKLHLSLQANKTVVVHLSGEYVCNCTSYEFVLEPNVENIILLESKSPVSGKFTAWQEIPTDKQILAIGLISIGLIGIYLTKRARIT